MSCNRPGDGFVLDYEMGSLVAGGLEDDYRKAEFKYNLQCDQRIERVVKALFGWSQEAGYESQRSNPGERRPSPGKYCKNDCAINANGATKSGTPAGMDDGIFAVS